MTKWEVYQKHEPKGATKQRWFKLHACWRNQLGFSTPPPNLTQSKKKKKKKTEEKWGPTHKTEGGEWDGVGLLE